MAETLGAGLGRRRGEGRLAYLQQARSIFSEVESTLHQAIPNKRGEALMVGLETSAWLQRHAAVLTNIMRAPRRG